ncbi:MAG TPA: hypothetical protein ENH15_03225 [Actinobacteria bacterium]|nr:hypothetical protein [Actinomycetota bacterium]
MSDTDQDGYTFLVEEASSLPKADVVPIAETAPMVPDSATSPAEYISWRMNQIRTAMSEQMIEGVDYGIITRKDGKPISDKPSLFKPGAEHLLNMFEVDCEPEVVPELTYKAEDLSVVDLTIKMVGYHRHSKERLGAAMGAGTSREAKWSRPMCPDCAGGVWDNRSSKRDSSAPEWKRQLADFTCKDKCGWKGQNGGEMRTGFNPDQFNTIVKIVNKRALVALALTVTGASHFFGQDLEDMGVATAPKVTDAGRSTPSTLSEASVDDALSDAKPSRTVLITEADRLEDGTWPHICPYCRAAAEQKEFTDSKGVDRTKVQCTRRWCSGGDLKRGREGTSADHYFEWSVLGALSDVYAAGSTIDNLLSSLAEDGEVVEVEATAADVPFDSNEFLRSRLAVCEVNWTKTQINERIKTVRADRDETGQRWTLASASAVVVVVLDAYWAKFPDDASAPF